MERRDFLKALLGMAAGAGLPAPLEAIADDVALYTDEVAYTLSFFLKAKDGFASLPWRMNDASLRHMTQHGWMRVQIPFKAGTSAEAVTKAEGLMSQVVGNLGGVQLEWGGPYSGYLREGIGGGEVEGLPPQPLRAPWERT